MGEDPRVTRSKACLLAATIEILRSEGLAGVTIERIAADSGVAKTTIYRHWAGRGEIVFAALESLMEHSGFPDTGNLGGDLRFGLGHLAEGLDEAVWAQVLPAMIAAAEHDEHIRSLSQEFVARRRAGLERRLQRAAESGEIAPGIHIEMFAAALVGPLFYRRFISRQPVTPELLDEHIARMLLSVLPNASSGSGERPR